MQNVYIIKGSINEGKTTNAKYLAERNKDIEGWICPKVFINGNFDHYAIQNIKTNKSMEFAYLKSNKPINWDEKYTCGDYSFSKSGFEFAQEIYLQSDKSKAFLCDEVGFLELNNKGFAKIVSKVLKSFKTVYLVIRNGLTNQVIDKLHLSNILYIDINQNGETNTVHFK